MTLIEILVVVFLIGLAASAAVMTLPETPDPVEAEARRLAGELRQSRDSAILSGQPIGLHFGRDQLQTKVWLDGRWRTVSTSAIQPDGASLSVVPEAGRAGTERIEIEGWPQLIFDPTGVTEDVRLLYRNRMRDYEFRVDGRGEVAFGPD